MRMDFAFTEEQRGLRWAVREFVRQRVSRRNGEMEDSDRLAGLLREAAAQGFLGLLAEEDGGPGRIPWTNLVIVLEEVARHDPVLGELVALQGGLVPLVLRRAGTPAARSLLEQAVAEEPVVACWAADDPYVERRRVGPQVAQSGGAAVIRAHKAWVSFLPLARWALVTTDAAGHPGAGDLFLIDLESDGVEVRPRTNSLLPAGLPMADLVVRDLPVPAERILPGHGPEGAAERERIRCLLTAAVALGTAAGALEQAAEYANQRQAFGKVIGHFGMIQKSLGDMDLWVKSMRLMVYRLAWLEEQGQATRTEAYRTRLFAAERAEQVCDGAMQVFGGYGFTDAFAIGTFLAAARLALHRPGSAHDQLRHVAQDRLGWLAGAAVPAEEVV